jgi:aldose 1-epimerase
MSSPINQSGYGTMPDGTGVELLTLENAGGLTLRAITYGATITELHVPDRAGRPGDIVLGYRSLEEYRASGAYMGCAIGRFANRIAGGRFTLDGRTYSVPVNLPPNSLHGGYAGFDKAVWTASAEETPDGPRVAFEHVSPDGDQGFPGTLRVRMTYSLTHANELRIGYEAQTDRATPINLTHHGYFNLACGGNVLGHLLQINARRYTPVDASMIPTGELAQVAGGPFDFTEMKPIGWDLGSIPGADGYDHNFVIDPQGAGPALAARVYEPTTGRAMEVLTDEPGIQLFTSANLVGAPAGKRGGTYPPFPALCLETQHFPNSVNEPRFPPAVLRPGATFASTTIYRFSAR